MFKSLWRYSLNPWRHRFEGKLIGLSMHGASTSESFTASKSSMAGQMVGCTYLVLYKSWALKLDFLLIQTRLEFYMQCISLNYTYLELVLEMILCTCLPILPSWSLKRKETAQLVNPGNGRTCATLHTCWWNAIIMLFLTFHAHTKKITFRINVIIFCWVI